MQFATAIKKATAHAKEHNLATDVIQVGVNSRGIATFGYFGRSGKTIRSKPLTMRNQFLEVGSEIMTILPNGEIVTSEWIGNVKQAASSGRKIGN